jgi:hypothetical protein
MTCPAAPAALTVAPGAPPTGGAPSGAPPDGPPFQSALATESARTAIAEGQQQSPSQDLSPVGSEGSSAMNAPQPAERWGRLPSRLAGHRPSHTRGRTAAGSTVASFAPSVAADWSGLGSVATPTAALPRLATKAQRASVPSASSAKATLLADTPAAGDDGVPTRMGRLDAGDDTPAKTSAVAGANAGASVGASAGANAGANAGATSIDDSLLAGATAEGAAGAATPSEDLMLSGARPAPASGTDNAPGHIAPSLLRASLADATLDSTSHTGGAGDGGASNSSGAPGGWRSRMGAHQFAEQESHRAAGDADVHDKLWVPGPASAFAGAGADVSDVQGIAAAAGLLESAVGAQGYTELSNDPQATLPSSGVSLQQAIETLHGTIQLASRGGLSQVRIALEPEGLGEIRINLTQTAQGLLARVSAETPVAAQALAAAHTELRQSLSSLGLNLARLDIGRDGHLAAQGGGTALGGGGRDGAGGGEAPQGGNRPGRSTATTAPTDLASGAESEADAQPAPVSSRETLIDVFA